VWCGSGARTCRTGACKSLAETASMTAPTRKETIDSLTSCGRGKGRDGRTGASNDSLPRCRSEPRFITTRSQIRILPPQLKPRREIKSDRVVKRKPRRREPRLFAFHPKTSQQLTSLGVSCTNVSVFKQRQTLDNPPPEIVLPPEISLKIRVVSVVSIVS